MIFDFEKTTLSLIKKFNDLFDEIRKKYPTVTMPMIRNYINSGNKIEGIPDELYNDLDKLYQIRLEAIKTESNHIISQAKKSGLKVPDDIISGKSLIPFFEDEIYEKISTLRVYEYMTFYTTQEIAQMSKKDKNIEDDYEER